MHLLPQILVLVTLALTVVPGLKTIAKAQLPAPAPVPAAIPLSLPRCARPAQSKIFKAFGCGMNDASCVCSKKDFLPRLLSATSHVCNQIDQKAVKQFAATYCGEDPSTIALPLPSTTRMTLPNQPTVTYECSPLKKSTSTLRPRTSTKTTRITKTKTKPSTGEATATSKGMIGGASRVDSGMGAAALIGAVAGIGWVFAEL